MATQGKMQNRAFPLDDLTYDLLTIVHEKSKALEAYDKYLNDAQNDQQVRSLLEQIKNEDSRHIEQLTQHLTRCLQNAGSQVGQGQSFQSGQNVQQQQQQRNGNR